MDAFTAPALLSLSSLLIGACITYASNILLSQRKHRSERAALGCAIAAEIDVNNSIVVYQIRCFWEAIDAGAEHIRAHTVTVHKSIFAAMHGNFGLIDSDQLAKIVYFYARLEELISHHNTLLPYLKYENPLEVGGYATHRINLQALADELTEDASALVVALRTGVVPVVQDLPASLKPTAEY